ncbi:MAG TPA: imidazolonepropionase [Terriglobales bacterium]|nr:imidazolonepropionase [Terriglobales bacterium]
MSSKKHKTAPAKSLLLVNIGQLVTLRKAMAQSGPRRGTELRELSILQDAAVLCQGGKIVSVGKTKDAFRDPWVQKNRKRIVEVDCAGQVVLPGFVDSHTHPVFVQPRLLDFEKRAAGATYEEIAEAGGGIRSSVEPVRKAGKTALAEKVLEALREMAELGTTTVEAKSGYGLTPESELKSLEAIRMAALQWPGTLVSTLLGAHVVPKEFAGRSRNYVEIVCKEMVPAAARRKLAQFVDVFCDRGAFTAEETASIFGAAREHGLKTRAHMGQLSETSLAPILQFEPVSLDHMDHVSEDDVKRLATSNTVATFVPGANYFLGLDRYPPARRFIEAGAAVALATDYNPGSSPTASMPFILSLACTHMKMTPAEAVSAATINGAWALGLQDSKGSIEAGKDADLACFEAEDYREIAYWFASNRCAFSVLNGVVIASGGSSELA